MKKELSKKELWDTFYKRRKGIKYLSNPKKYRSHFELIHIFKKFIPINQSIKLLELGAGDSIWLPYFAKNFGFQVYGVDYSIEGCNLAKRNLKLAGVNGIIICKNFLQMEESFSEFFDIVISFGVIEHFEDTMEVLNIFKNFLKKGGMLITIIPNTAGLIMQLQKLIDKEIYDTHKLMDLEELKKFHENIGLKIIIAKYLQVGDLSVLNYQNVVSQRLLKFIARSITALNLPILYLQKIFNFFPQSKKLCSSMIVIAKKKE